MHPNAEPDGKVAEGQAQGFAPEFLRSAEEVAPVLPSSTAGKARAQPAELEEHWGVGLSALLDRAAALGIAGAVVARRTNIRGPLLIQHWLPRGRASRSSFSKAYELTTSARLEYRQDFDAHTDERHPAPVVSRILHGSVLPRTGGHKRLRSRRTSNTPERLWSGPRIPRHGEISQIVACTRRRRQASACILFPQRCQPALLDRFFATIHVDART